MNSMEYFVEDTSGYCLERSLPTLEMARQSAAKHPTATKIVEYTDARTTPKGVIPTGRAWNLGAPTSLHKEKN